MHRGQCAAPQVEELPDVIPEELYAAELESPEEQHAFQQLLTPQPGSPAPAQEEDYQEPASQHTPAGSLGTPTPCRNWHNCEASV